MDVDGEDNNIHELSEGSDDDDDNSQEIKDLEVSYFVRVYFRPTTKSARSGLVTRHAMLMMV